MHGTLPGHHQQQDPQAKSRASNCHLVLLSSHCTGSLFHPSAPSFTSTSDLINRAMLLFSTSTLKFRVPCRVWRRSVVQVVSANCLNVRKESLQLSSLTMENLALLRAWLEMAWSMDLSHSSAWVVGAQKSNMLRRVPGLRAFCKTVSLYRTRSFGTHKHVLWQC